ncbi:hypothetical protein [Enterovirga sp.]|uniref:hypothetical protein n=1 Tax=Enterovirga sp. TaxID=2026350 RepID=UPI002BBEA931|nr:hypothetical protein [Enterovirga sp.]HMO29186.1 hypothetical protein [Enterovirga sp.]
MRRIAAAILAGCLVAGEAGAQIEAPLGGRTKGMLGIPPVTEPATPPGAAEPPGPARRTGKAKPPGKALGEGDQLPTDLERRQEELDRRIRKGICRGC